MPTRTPQPKGVSSQEARSYGAPRKVVVFATLFVLLACGITIAINGWLIWKGHQEELEDARSTAANLALAVARQVEASLEDVDNVLYAAASSAEAVEATEGQLRLGSMLNHFAGRESILRGLYIYDAEGRLVRTSTVVAFEDNVAKHPFFLKHRSESTRKMVLGRPLRNPSNQEAVITASRRMVDKNGDFLGVAVALLSVPEIERSYKVYDLGSDGLIALNLMEGILVARLPHLQEVGLDVSGTEIHRRFLSRSHFGTMTSTSPLDHVRRQYAFKRLEKYPLNVLVGISIDHALLKWKDAAVIQLIVVALATASLGGGGLWLVLQIQGRATAEARLRRAQAELESANVELHRLAQYDGLTGLANRRHFNSALEGELSRARREQSPLSVLLIDVDYFKRFNDCYGHPSGDSVLCRVALAIEDAARRPGDLACRYGGEEFVPLLPGTDGEGAAQVAEALRERIRNLNIRHETSPHEFVTVSIGVGTLMPGESSDPVGAADASLYLSKAEGRNRINPPIRRVA